MRQFDPYLTKVASLIVTPTDDTTYVHSLLAANVGIAVEADSYRPETVKGGLANGPSRAVQPICALTFDMDLTLPTSFDPENDINSVIGLLLRGCGYQEMRMHHATNSYFIVHNLNRSSRRLNDPANTYTITVQTYKTNVITEIALYQMTFIEGGDSQNAVCRISGGTDDLESNIPKSEQFSCGVYYPSNISYSSQLSCSVSKSVSVSGGSLTEHVRTYTFSGNGGCVEGAQIFLMIGGELFQYTLISSDDSVTALAASLASAITASSDLYRSGGYTADSSAGTLTITYNSNDTAYGYTPYDGTPQAVGGSGGATNMAETGSPTYVLGERWSFLALPADCYWYASWNSPIKDADKYQIVPAAYESEEIPLKLDFTVYYRNKKHLVSNAIGTYTIEMTPTQNAIIRFTFYGTYSTPTEIVSGQPSHYGITNYDADVKTFNFKPQLSNFILGDYSQGLLVKSFIFTQGNNVVKRSDSNSVKGYNGFAITGREPSVEVVLETPPNYVLNLWTEFDLQQEWPMLIRFGVDDTDTTKGIYLYVPAAQLSSPPVEGDDAGIRTMRCSFGAVSPVGHSEADAYLIFK